MRRLLFLWWDLHPSLNIRLFRRGSVQFDWHPAFQQTYQNNVKKQMSPAELAYIQSREYRT